MSILHLGKSKDHPRIRGEHPVSLHSPFLPPGSSPHSRGTPTLEQLKASGLGIIPAFAGNTSVVCHGLHCRRDHPRIRGEHFSLPRSQLLAPGSSPHSRGTPKRAGYKDRSARIIPAFAGNTFWNNSEITVSKDHPRIRGEHKTISAFV